MKVRVANFPPEGIFMNSSADVQVDVAILGAGSAGLAAMAEVKRHQQTFVLIDSGPLGTTCARTGCMPSKVFIELARDFSKVKQLQKLIPQTIASLNPGIPDDSSRLFERVREMRDAFVGGPIRTVEKNHEHFIHGRARLLSPNLLSVGSKRISFQKIIIATGSHPIIPADWPRSPRIVTSESFFELRELPKKAAVIGAGPLGLELAVAMGMLGVEVQVYDQHSMIGGLKDPIVERGAREALSEWVEFYTGHAVQLVDLGHAIQVKTAILDRLTQAPFEADLVLCAIGRRPNLDNLGLESFDVEIDTSGRVPMDLLTLQIGKLPIFLAGDCANDRPCLHEAVHEGQMAGYNACHLPQHFQRRARLSVVFTHPQLARVGVDFENLPSHDLLIGECSFDDQGRAKIMGEAKGVARIYANKSDGFILGAELAVPGAEHLAQFLVVAIEHQLTVFDLLKTPVYHPTLLEGLKPAFREIAKQVTSRPTLSF